MRLEKLNLNEKKRERKKKKGQRKTGRKEGENADCDEEQEVGERITQCNKA